MLHDVRVTRLAAFHQWLQGRLYIPEAVQEEKPNEVDQWLWYINQPASKAMDVGTAFHKVIEELEPLRPINTIERDGFVFDFSEVEIEVPDVLIAEHRHVALIENTFVSGTIDAATASSIIDWKTTGTYDANRYHDSYQWRFYLSMWEMPCFEYHVFPIKEDAKDGRYVIKGHHVQPEYAYYGMESDCRALVREWERFINA